MKSKLTTIINYKFLNFFFELLVKKKEEFCTTRFFEELLEATEEVQALQAHQVRGPAQHVFFFQTFPPFFFDP